MNDPSLKEIATHLKRVVELMSVDGPVPSTSAWLSAPGLCSFLLCSPTEVDRFTGIKGFPAPIRFGESLPPRWNVREVEAWLNKRAKVIRRDNAMVKDPVLAGSFGTPK